MPYYVQELSETKRHMKSLENLSKNDAARDLAEGDVNPSNITRVKSATGEARDGEDDSDDETNGAPITANGNEQQHSTPNGQQQQNMNLNVNGVGYQQFNGHSPSSQPQQPTPMNMMQPMSMGMGSYNGAMNAMSMNNNMYAFSQPMGNHTLNSNHALNTIPGPPPTDPTDANVTAGQRNGHQPVSSQLVMNTSDLPESDKEDEEEYNGLYDDPHDGDGLYSNQRTQGAGGTKRGHSGNTPMAGGDEENVGYDDLQQPQIQAVDTNQIDDEEYEYYEEEYDEQYDEEEQ